MTTEMLSPSHVGDKMGLTPQRVRQLIADGVFPHVRIGRRIYVPKAAWDSWLKDQTDKAMAAIADVAVYDVDVINDDGSLWRLESGVTKDGMTIRWTPPAIESISKLNVGDHIDFVPTDWEIAHPVYIDGEACEPSTDRVTRVK